MLLLWEIFLAFAKVGILGYGGGPSMIPLVQVEVVEVHHWLTNQEFVDTLAMGNALPGPIANIDNCFVGFEIQCGKFLHRWLNIQRGQIPLRDIAANAVKLHNADQGLG